MKLPLILPFRISGQQFPFWETAKQFHLFSLPKKKHAKGEFDMYFDSPGKENTAKTIELAVQASKTMISAM